MRDTARWRALDAEAREPLWKDHDQLILLLAQFRTFYAHVAYIRGCLNDTDARECLDDALTQMNSAQHAGPEEALKAVKMAIADLGLGPDEAKHAEGLGCPGRV